MKITNFEPEGFPIVLGGWSSGVVSLNSNAHMADGGFSALNFVQGITAEGSNMLARPISNFAAGSNIWLTLDAGPGNSIPSNTLRIHGQAGGGAAVISAGSNATRVREVSTAGASTTLWSPFDHAHDGIGTITSSSSNTMQRGTWNIRPGAGIALALTDSDGDGEFDTTTIVAAGAGSGSGGSDLVQTYSGGGSVYVPGLRGSPDAIQASPNAADEEFNGANSFSSTVGSLDTNNVSDFASYLHLKKTTSGTRIDGVYKASPAATGTITCKVSSIFSAANHAAGIVIGDSTPTAWATFMPIYVTVNAVYNASKWTNSTTRGTFTDVTLNPVYGPAAGWVYLRVIVNSATSIHCDYSRDGFLWTRTHSAYNPGLTMANYGVVVSAFGAVAIEGVFDWVRWSP